MTSWGRAGVMALVVGTCATTGLAARAQDSHGSDPGPQDAGAPSSDEQRAQDLKRRGDDLVRERRYDEALEAYEQSYAVVPNPAILYNKGRALQFLSRYPEALSALERFAREAPPDLRAKVGGIEELMGEVRKRVCTLTVTSNAPGARVMVRGTEIGATPLTVRLNAGPASLEVTAEGYTSQKRQLELAGGGEAILEVNLLGREHSGIVVVTSKVAGAAVFVDGRAQGAVPSEVALEAGTHEVRVARQGYEPVTSRVVLAAGERREIALDPVATPPITSRWWFWTAVGVGLAGATTAIVVFATKSPSDTSGDQFSPSRAPAP